MTNLAWHSPADLLGQLATAISAGRIVRIGEFARPHYQLIAIDKDRVWIRDIQSGTDHALPKARWQAV